VGAKLRANIIRITGKEIEKILFLERISLRLSPKNREKAISVKKR
jgi:hypothetical protein